jgi:hypothetical protein
MRLSEGYGMATICVFICILTKHNFRCFPHIVNLACKVVIAAITDPNFIDKTQDGYEEYNPDLHIHDQRDVIANL